MITNFFCYQAVNENSPPFFLLFPLEPCLYSITGQRSRHFGVFTATN